MTVALDPANIVGLIGSGMMAFAYAYSNWAGERMSFLLFNLLNLVGAILLGWSLTVHFNLASFLLELLWGAIALVGLIKAVRAR